MGGSSLHLEEMGRSPQLPTWGDAGSTLAHPVSRTGGVAKASCFLWEAAAQAIRVVGTPDNPWFVAKDVCAAVGISGSHVSESVASLDIEDKGNGNIVTLGGEQKMLIVSESGLYALIFRGRKEQARQFSKWVTSEVLPAIRQTGQYQVGPARASREIVITHRYALPAAAMGIDAAVVSLIRSIRGAMGGTRGVLVHTHTIVDFARRDPGLALWFGSRRPDFQSNARFMRNLNRYCGRPLAYHNESGECYLYSITAERRNRHRFYVLDSHGVELPKPTLDIVPESSAIALVQSAFTAREEVFVK